MATALQLSLITDPSKSIQMGDTITIHVSDTVNFTGIIRQYDYNNGNVLLEDFDVSLSLFKDYLYFIKDIT